MSAAAPEFFEIPIVNTGTTGVLIVDTKLSGRGFRLTFKWNGKAQVWTLDVDTEAGESVIAGRLVALQRDLLAGAVHPERPSGLLVAARASTDVVELPSLEGLGTAVRVYHVV